MNYNGLFKIAIEQRCKKATYATFTILCKCREIDMPVDILLDLFDKLVIPVMYVFVKCGFFCLFLKKKDLLEK